MNTSEFRIARDKQLSDFQKQYSDMKTEYTTAVINALKEQDRSKQCILLQQVLNANKKITNHLKSFTSTLDAGTCKANPTLIPKLKDDIQKYNKEYEEIQQGENQLAGLQNAIENTKQKTVEIKDMFSWYAVLIAISVVLLIFIVIFRSSSNIFNTDTSTSVFSPAL